tara:strand:- start:516 stop:863 length:348 start_codon:yes stop_codon:yes gene_type:complete
MKIKTFKKADETEVNDFLEGVRVLNDGVYQSDETITFTYIEGTLPEITKEQELIDLHIELVENSKRTKSLDRDLRYLDEKETEETDGADRRKIKAGIARMAVDLKFINEDLEKLA